MILLILFAFIAGIVTILSPCILPVLPIILSSTTDTSGKKRPLGVVLGFVFSFTFFTLSLSVLVRLLGIPASSLRIISIVILIVFGLSLILPRIQLLLEQMFVRLTNMAPTTSGRSGFWGGMIIGLSLGLLWTPCVGPILASVISLAITGSVTAETAIITFSYSLGTALPMFVIMQAGSAALRGHPWLLKNTGTIQKTFGVLMVLTAVGIYFNLDRSFQTWVLQTFPGYGLGLTKIEDNQAVRSALGNLSGKPVDESIIGKPTMDLMEKGVIAPAIVAGGDWFNSSPLVLESLKGKVVLIDFWTYSCINCQRTFPYLRSWWNKYKDKGLVIIGVHSPEFEFEKDKNNLRQAIADFDLRYPIVQDNEFATWLAYNNRYWPAKYLIDKDGYIRYTHFGEGDYDATERAIRGLLFESGAGGLSGEVNNPDYEVLSATPEIYLGYLRLTNMVSPENVVKDGKQNYSVPSNLSENSFALAGEWFISGEFAAPSIGSRLLLNFESKEVFLVARPKKDKAKIKVYLDDKLHSFGEDNKDGVVTVDADKLYKLIKLVNPGRHILKLEFDGSEVELFAFTFG